MKELISGQGIYGYNSDGVDTDRATRKKKLNCMSALSVRLVPNAESTGSQQLSTICTCVAYYTHRFV